MTPEMTLDEITAFNAEWLRAWTAKDVEAVCAFYAGDCDYKDAQTAGGLKGRDALRQYLTGLFAATPPMTYAPDAVWPIAGGFCGRWFCDMGEPGTTLRLRGFDLVLLRGRQIALNEVYVHQLPA